MRFTEAGREFATDKEKGRIAMNEWKTAYYLKID